MKKTLLNLYNKLTDVHKEMQFGNVKNFCNALGYSYNVIRGESVCKELHPCIWNKRKAEEVILRSFPETYVAEIKNATIIGENELIICKDNVLCDTYTCEFAGHMELKKGVVQKVDLLTKEVEVYYHNVRHLPIEKGICLVGNFSYSYYHFLINILPKLYYVYRNERYKDYPLIFDSRAYRSFKDIIDYFNIYKNKVICVNQNVAYKVKNLVVASNCTWYDRYVLENFYKDAGHRFDREAIHYVREMCLKKIQTNGILEKVYVSRTRLPKERRRLVNEEQVESVFHKYGFTSVYPEELSFWEQVQLFKNVKYFAGVAGAAFTNMIFLPKDATIIYSTFLEGNSGENLYPTLWNAVGEGRFFLLQGEETDESREGNLKDNLRKFELNMNEIEELLSSI